MEDCSICQKSLNGHHPTVNLTIKGCVGVNKASTERGEDIHVKEGQRVHSHCRKTYTNPRAIAVKKRKYEQGEHTSSTESTPKRALRSEEEGFDYANHCLFCGKSGKWDWKTKSYNLFPVRTETQFQNTIKQICVSRQDEWSIKVLSRLEFGRDCFARDCVYHHACSVNFRTNKHIPKQTMEEEIPVQANSTAKQGRPLDGEKSEAFEHIVKYIQDHEDEQISLFQLCNIATDSSIVYNQKTIKRKLKERFGDTIIITELIGKSGVVTLKPTASTILHNFFCKPRSTDTESEKKRIIDTAANLIKADFKAIQPNKDHYPAFEDISSLAKNLSFLPVSIKTFLSSLFNSKDMDVKIASIGQAIVQASRPRMVPPPPLQVGLGIQLHHLFGSKVLIDSLHSHGFCASYSEIKKFEHNAAAAHGTDFPEVSERQCIQFVADNVDHNSRTLDGKNTFHGMGIIATVTPSTTPKKSVPRADLKPSDVTNIGKIGIHYFKSEWNSLSSLKYNRLNIEHFEDPSRMMDLLWQISWPLKSPHPSWSGFMQLAHQGSHAGKSSVFFLPMIDMNPSDLTCVYSTLKYVSNLARKHKVAPILTFDQPLWWKARTIIESERSKSDWKSLVLRLGGFHTEMSFLGYIGHLMEGSGLHELLETVYSPNTICHMMSGKAVTRAVRGHLLVDTALNSLILMEAYSLAGCLDSLEDGCERQGGECESLISTNTDLREAQKVFESVVSERITVEDVCNQECLSRIAGKLDTYRASKKGQRTPALWFQYMEMIDILCKFIKAERTGNWQHHLSTLAQMLPYFASSGHNHYTKSVRIYLQDMLQLQISHPDVHAHFENGLHVVRRSNRFWAGLSTDLVIEQVLMRSLKTSGGLTRGRGMGEVQRVTWLLSMPACAAVNDAMQELTCVQQDKHCTHKDMTASRLERDHQDVTRMIQFLYNRNPFTDEVSLHNISTGEVAGSNVNPDEALKQGGTIIEMMTNKNVLDFVFKKKYQVTTMASKSGLKIDGDVVHIDQQLLFQRLVAALDESPDNIADVFKFELCTVPSSLFDSSCLLRQANKPALSDSMWTLLKTEDLKERKVPEDSKYVLDGGALLQRIVWPRGYTYGDIVQLYVDYVSKRYAFSTVVFDGYEQMYSTKDVTHLRRGNKKGTRVNFTQDMVLCSKKEDFLCNKENKQLFINALADALTQSGCQVHCAKGDADLMIVQTAVAASKEHTVVLVGDDTDLLVLLCHHADVNSNPIIFRPEHKTSSKKPSRVWWITDVKSQLGPNICENILFIHAFLGCDTTSRLFGLGKGLILKKINNDKTTQSIAKIFLNKSPQEEVISAGEKMFVSLYGGSQCDSLDTLRHVRFCEKVRVSITSLQPQVLPPTSAAAKYHSLRVYYQIQEWKGELDPGLHPQDWGWKVSNDRLVPVMSDLAPAPAYLLRAIRCKCKTDCSSSRCSCRKHGLECTPSCGECRGVSCSNSQQVDENLE